MNFAAGIGLRQVAEIDLRERVGPLVANVAGHVEAIEQIVDVVGAGDPFARQDVAHAGLEDERLLPGRAGFETLARLVVGIAHADGDEIFSASYFRLEFFGLRADLRAFDIVLRQIAVQLRIALVAVVAPAGGEKKVHDVQAEAEVARPGLLVEKRSGRDAADIAFLANDGLQSVGIDLNRVGGFDDGDGAIRRGLRLGGLDRGGCAEGEKSEKQKRQSHVCLYYVRLQAEGYRLQDAQAGLVVRLSSSSL